jgi:hypothetical protein
VTIENALLEPVQWTNGKRIVDLQASNPPGRCMTRRKLSTIVAAMLPRSLVHTGVSECRSRAPPRLLPASPRSISPASAPGPTCVRQLADWGANVIKIDVLTEDAAGEQRLGSDFQNLHRNKRAITLN